MTLLDDRLLTARGIAADWAAEMAEHALAADRDPDAVRELLHLSCMAYLATSPVPEEYVPTPITVDGHRFSGMSTLERVVFIEELAVGDPGLLLGAPGPSLSGGLLLALGNDDQKKRFYDALFSRPTWTFFGLTEPDRGSDVGAMTTTLTRRDGKLLLNGAKRYCGNAARARLGVVFARTAPGPLGVTSVLVETDQPGFVAEPIPTLGLRANQICDIRLTDVEVREENVLGQGLTGTQRGMWGALRALNTFRPGVGALALGIARAAHAYALRHRSAPTAWQRHDLDRTARRIDATRALLHRAAVAVDHSREGGYLASAAKARATHLAEDATQQALALFGPGARYEHPLLDKLDRDARGVEFMEGTSNIHRLNLFQGLIRGEVGRG
ncbi:MULTISPECIES: acyl-CoA dehydrogenase family protein [unclassified Streptomyces]|uniref:acyl-CoA dehydrogenase family protein n=1 Tax=unclassified Streptomyces TaxID=2593676 RepID=UPI000DAE9076|nr:MULTISPECIES: acyl-CoA dehydrogenase family protein [unclassified Streptomyces]PZT77062.1 acyl-CoA dehydrogenase [Streptomyces sp. AC1-42W]PZT78985.1 acyl-CoA dehydrogenase [Streptomyces sp. AC1-42T]